MSRRYFRNVGFKLHFSEYINNSNYNYDQLWFNYNNKFLGSLVFRGRKLHAYKMLLQVRHGLKVKEGIDPSLIFLIAMMRITPEVCLRFVKMGGGRYGVPAPISYKKKISYATKWIIKLLRDKNKTRRLTVSSIVELLRSSLRNKGEAVQKKQELYRIASLNRHLIYRYLK